MTSQTSRSRPAPAARPRLLSPTLPAPSGAPVGGGPETPLAPSTVQPPVVANTQTVPDAIDAYRDALKQIRLLSAEEEVALGARIQAGTRLGDDGRLLSITPDAQEALETLWVRNLRLVPPIAAHYVGHGMALEDLVSCGNLGLRRAALKYDPARGNRFSTHAVWWVRQAVARALGDQGNILRIPIHAGTRLRMVEQTRHALYAATASEATTADLQAALPALSPVQWRLVEQASRVVLSLDQPIERHSPRGASLYPVEQTLADELMDTSCAEAEDLAEAVSAQVDRERAVAGVHAVMQRYLTPRQRAVMALRFGIGMPDLGIPPLPQGLSLAEIGRLLKSMPTGKRGGAGQPVSRERVRQILEAGLHRLRMARAAGALREAMLALDLGHDQ